MVFGRRTRKFGTIWTEFANLQVMVTKETQEMFGVSFVLYHNVSELLALFLPLWLKYCKATGKDHARGIFHSLHYCTMYSNIGYEKCSAHLYYWQPNVIYVNCMLCLYYWLP